MRLLEFLHEMEHLGWLSTAVRKKTFAKLAFHEKQVVVVAKAANSYKTEDLKPTPGFHASRIIVVGVVLAKSCSCHCTLVHLQLIPTTTLPSSTFK